MHNMSSKWAETTCYYLANFFSLFKVSIIWWKINQFVRFEMVFNCLGNVDGFDGHDYHSFKEYWVANLSFSIPFWFISYLELHSKDRYSCKKVTHRQLFSIWKSTVSNVILCMLFIPSSSFLFTNMITITWITDARPEIWTAKNYRTK